MQGRPLGSAFFYGECEGIGIIFRLYCNDMKFEYGFYKSIL